MYTSYPMVRLKGRRIRPAKTDSWSPSVGASGLRMVGPDPIIFYVMASRDIQRMCERHRCHSQSSIIMYSTRGFLSRYVYLRAGSSSCASAGASAYDTPFPFPMRFPSSYRVTIRHPRYT